jgi:signal transduction histidine kinase
MRFSIPAKVLSGFAAVLLTFAMVTAFSIYQLHRVGVGLSLVSNTYHPLTRLTGQLDASYRDSATASERLLRETDVDTRRGLLKLAIEYHPRAAREKLKAAQAVMKDARAAEPGTREQGFLDRIDGLLDGILARYDAYQRIGTQAAEILVRLEESKRQGVSISTVEAEFDGTVRDLKKTEEGIGNALKDLASELDDRIDQRVQQAGQEEQQSILLIVGFSALAVMIGVFITLATQRILAPIRRLTEAVKDVGEGQFARELAVHSDDELAILAREFNAMARKLRDRDRQLQEKTAEVLRAERLAAVGRLAAQITHEIRNPLSSLSLNTELLQERLEGGIDDAAGKSEAHALLRSMAREMDRLAEITEEYLRFARQPKPALGPVDLNDSVDELVDFMLPELAKGGVTATRDLAAAEPRVRADPSQLRQVLLNLVRNAREAAGTGGRIHIRTRTDAAKGVARLEVEDDGPGVPAELRAHLFEPFFSTKERGTGLGLAVVQQIVHEHGGEVTCHAVLPKGTRFVVALPLADSLDHRPRALEAEVEPAPTGEGR